MKLVQLKTLFSAFVFCTIPLVNAQLPPVVQSYSTTIGDEGDAVIAKPEGCQAGDLLIASITLEKGTDATIVAPAGWALIRRTDNSTDAGIATYYKMAGLSEPSTYEFELTGQKWAAGISRVTGYSTAKPIDVSAGSTGNFGNVVAPSVVPTTGNALVLAFYTNKKGATYTPALDTTEVYDAPNVPGGAPSHMMATFAQLLPTATGDKTAVPQQRDKWAAQQIVITPNDGFPNHGLLSIQQIAAGTSQVHYQGLPGLNYNVEYADELQSPNTLWTVLENQATDASGRVIISDTSASTSRFYRAILVP